MTLLLPNFPIVVAFYNYNERSKAKKLTWPRVESPLSQSPFMPVRSRMPQARFIFSSFETTSYLGQSAKDRRMQRRGPRSRVRVRARLNAS